MKAQLAIVLLLCSSLSAHAGLTEQELRKVALAPPPNASIPLGVVFRDTEGRHMTLRAAIGERPALILFADYTCRTICKPSLAIAADALRETGLSPKDYRLLVIGLDRKDTSADAKDMLNQIGDPSVAASTVALMSDGDNVDTVAQAAGYSYKYDAAVDQIAHPAGIIVLAASGRISRVLSSLSLNPHDLRLALVEAGEGRVGQLADRLTLLCYGFDAVHGVYTFLIRTLLEIAATLTVFVLAGVLLLLLRRERRSRGSPA